MDVITEIAGCFYLNPVVTLELLAYKPDIHEACERAMMSVSSDLDFIRIDHVFFAESLKTH